MKIDFGWEVIEHSHGSRTCRAKVYGGWIVANSIYEDLVLESDCMVFVPDIKHEWEI